MFCMLQNKKYLAYLSKHNSNREKQVMLLMISNGERRKAKSEGRWRYYLAVKKLTPLLRGITSKNIGNFYCLNCLYSFKTKSKIEPHKEVCKKDFFSVIMPSQGIRI